VHKVLYHFYSFLKKIIQIIQVQTEICTKPVTAKLTNNYYVSTFAMKKCMSFYGKE